MTLSSLLKYTLPIWVIICYESDMPITNNKGFRPLVVTLEELLEADGQREVRISVEVDVEEAKQISLGKLHKFL